MATAAPVVVPKAAPKAVTFADMYGQYKTLSKGVSDARKLAAVKARESDQHG